MKEWRIRIILFLIPGGKDYYICHKDSLIQNFKGHLDKNFYLAFNSLVQDNYIIRANDFPDLYAINLQKISAIEDEIFTSNEEIEIDVVQPFDRNFSDMTFVFESETDRNLPNKGKYYHFTKKEDNSFWVSVVKTKGSLKSNKLIIGSLNNPKNRLYKIRRAIIRITNETGNDTFIKKNVEDIELYACGNTRQYSRAALDILEYLGLIHAVRSNGRSPIYIITNKISIGIEELIEKRLKHSKQLSLEEFLKHDEWLG